MTREFWLRTVATGVLAALALAAPSSSFALATGSSTAAEDPTSTSQFGYFLAGLIATADRDTAAAEENYVQALKSDPHNPDLIDRAFTAALSNGDVESASAFAERLPAHSPNAKFAKLAISVHLIEHGDYAGARMQLASGEVDPRDVTSKLLTAWCYAGQGDLRRALDTLDHLRDQDLAAFRDFHAGLIAHQLGNDSEAERRLKSAYEADKNALRFADAYARFLADHNDRDGAMKVYDAFLLSAPRHPIVENALADLKSGRSLPAVTSGPKDGVAEVLYGLGAAGIREGDELPALVYLRLSLYLRPHDDLTSVTLASLFEQMKQDEHAIATYESVPETSALREDAEIQAALVQDGLGQSDEASKRLEAIVAKRPNDVDALSALAGVQRSAKMYKEAASTYDKAIAAIGITTHENWTLFYFRGICFERAKDWPKAEEDFKKALELYPDEPMVLNYLGYSWVDQGIKLDEAFKMLRRAVEQRPNDGYIVDSLGWAHYKLGQYSEATQTLERAVDLKPADPVLNDHLGDAYWRVNRRVEARFQWNHARDMKPDPEDLPAILDKIEKGLPDGDADLPVSDRTATQGGGG